MKETAINGKTINLGLQGENFAREISFDISEYYSKYGSEGSFLLLVQRNGDAAPYSPTVTVQGSELLWPLTSTDTAKSGYGKCQLQYYVGDRIIKSAIWKTVTVATLDEGNAEAPAPWQSWVDDVMDAAETIQTDLSRKAELETISLTDESTVSLSAGNTTVISGTPASVQVTLPTPAEGLDFLCGLIFRAGDDLAFSDTAPEGYGIKWEDEPTWAENTIYEIIYRCLWIADSNEKVIISAKYAEVSE